MNNIRQATPADVARVAEIEIFNYRLNFYPIFQNDWFYFDEKQVPKEMKRYETEEGLLENTYVYDDGVVKGFIQLDGSKVAKLFVEPVLQGNGIGAEITGICRKRKAGRPFMGVGEERESNPVL